MRLSWCFGSEEQIKEKCLVVQQAWISPKGPAFENWMDFSSPGMN